MVGVDWENSSILSVQKLLTKRLPVFGLNADCTPFEVVAHKP